MSLEHPRSVEDLLTFRVNRLMASGGAMITRLCEGEYGITRREWRLICLLASRGPQSPSALAAAAHLERARVSKHLTDLIDKKLVARNGVEEDGRRALLALTEAGNELYESLFPRSVQLHSSLLSVLTSGERSAFEQALQKLIVHAESLVQNAPVQAKADRRHGGSRQHRPLSEPSSWAAFSPPPAVSTTQDRGPHGPPAP